MPRVTAPKKTVRKKPVSAKTGTAKKTAKRRPSTAVTSRPKKPASRAVAPDGVPWPPIPRITRKRGNYSAAELRAALRQAIAAVEAEQSAQQKAVP